MSRPGGAFEVLDVLQVLWALNHALEARSKRMHRDIGITGPQRLLLRVVGQAPGCGPGTAARRLRLDPGTVTRLAAGLERQALLRREVDPLDRRKKRLVLTPRGRSLNRRHRATVEGAVREVLAAATTGEVRLASRFIDRLTGRLTVRVDGRKRSRAVAGRPGGRRDPPAAPRTPPR